MVVMAVLKQGRIFYWGKSGGFRGSKGWQEGWLILKTEDEASPSWGPGLSLFRNSTCKKQIGKDIQLISVAADTRFRSSAIQYGPPKKKDPKICTENLIGVPKNPKKDSIVWLCAFSVPELRKWLSAIARSVEGLAEVPLLVHDENGVTNSHYQNGHIPDSETILEVNGTEIHKLRKADSLHDLLSSAEPHKSDADWALYWWNMPAVAPETQGKTGGSTQPETNGAIGDGPNHKNNKNLTTPEENGPAMESLNQQDENGLNMDSSNKDESNNSKPITGGTSEPSEASKKPEEEVILALQVAKTTKETSADNEVVSVVETKAENANQQTGDNERSKETLSSGQDKIKKKKATESLESPQSLDKVENSEQKSPESVDQEKNEKKKEKENLKQKLEVIEQEKLKKKSEKEKGPEKPKRATAPNCEEELVSKEPEQQEKIAAEKVALIPPAIKALSVEEPTEEKTKENQKSKQDQPDQEQKSVEENVHQAESQEKEIDGDTPVTPRIKTGLTASDDKANREPSVYFDSEQPEDEKTTTQ